MRVCRKCGGEKPIEHFRKSRGVPTFVCADCRNAETRKLRADGRIKLDPQLLAVRKQRTNSSRKARRVWLEPRERAKRIAYKRQCRRTAGVRERALSARRRWMWAAHAARAFNVWRRFIAPKAKPWNVEGLSAAERFRIRYRLDAEFAQRQRERTTRRRYLLPAYAAQYEGTGRRWFRACSGEPNGVSRAWLRELQSSAICPYCLERTTRRQRHIDHVQPVSLGGTHSDDNIVNACATCNRAKGARSLLAFLGCRASGPSGLS